MILIDLHDIEIMINYVYSNLKHTFNLSQF